MGASFLILLREGIEAALIVAIVLAYLQRKAAGKGKGYVWSGVGLAVVASLVTAGVFKWIVGGFSGRAEEIFEGILMLVACGVLIYMVIWTARAARDFKATLTDKVDAALARGQLWSLAALVFMAVFREGVETVLFLSAIPSSRGFTGLIGAVLGLLVAIGIGFAYFKSSEKINLRRFFQVTAVLLILIGSGLGAHGVHELQEAGVVPIIKKQTFDLNPEIKYVPGPVVESSAANLIEAQPHLKGIIDSDGSFMSQKIKPYKVAVEAGFLTVANPVKLALHEQGSIGSLVKAIFGYNPNPTLLELMTYIVLITGSTILFYQLSRKPEVE